MQNVLVQNKKITAISKHINLEAINLLPYMNRNTSSKYLHLYWSGMIQEAPKNSSVEQDPCPLLATHYLITPT